MICTNCNREIDYDSVFYEYNGIHAQWLKNALWITLGINYQLKNI